MPPPPWQLYFNTHWKELNARRSDGRLLVIGEAAVFDLEMPVLYSTCFDDSPFERMAKGRTATEIRAALVDSGVTYVYVDWGEIARYRSPGNYGFTGFIQPALFDQLVEQGVLEPLRPWRSARAGRIACIREGDDGVKQCERVGSAEQQDAWSASEAQRAPAGDAPLPAACRAIRRTRAWLLAQQDPAGFWCGELEGDTILESETILLLAFFGREHSDLARRCARYLLRQQLSGGGWAMYPGGGVDVSGSVKAYFALKLSGEDPGSEPLRRARRAILAHGGADASNSYTRFYLALLGQISVRAMPGGPARGRALAPRCPVNLYRISAWSRTIVVPLSIVWAFQPVRRLPPELAVGELFLRDPAEWPPSRCPGLRRGTGLWSWDRFFRTIDAAMKWCRRRGVLPLRRRALAEAERWMLARFAHSEGLGAIYPPLVWSRLALHCLGYADGSPEVQYCERQLARLGARRSRLRHEPAPAVQVAGVGHGDRAAALGAAGLRPAHPAAAAAVAWLLEQQISAPGRLVDDRPGPARCLGLRVRQRLLS